MAKEWISYAGALADPWNIPAAVIVELRTFMLKAQTALDTAKNENTRTPVATAQCKAAFDALTAFMRDFKRRYFLSPPLTDADYIALGLKPHDPIPTPSGAPTAHVTVETFLAGRRELGIKLRYVDGSPDDPANKGYRIYYRVAAPGETPPEDPERPGELPLSFFTKRRRVEYRDSGKTAYFAVQIENDGKKGPWGPLTSSLIP
jgi:hypothetical protein